MFLETYNLHINNCVLLICFYCENSEKSARLTIGIQLFNRD